MRFFQPITQFGFARLLAETRTHKVLSPGLIGLDSNYDNGYTAFFDIPFPPKIDFVKEEIYKLNFLFNKDEEKKVLSNNLIFSKQPFYPYYVPKALTTEDFKQYVSEFLSNSDQYKQIFTLPEPFIDSSILDDVIKTDVSFIILTGLKSLFYNQRKLTKTLVNLRNKISPDVALYVPGLIPPAFYSFLIYSGIDFIDDSYAFYISKNGYFLTEDVVYSIDNHPICYCNSCIKNQENLYNHNKMILKNKLSKIRYHLENNTFRSMLERDIHNNPTLAAALRYYDTEYEYIFRKRTPIIAENPVICIGEESINRPEIKEYRERLSERFTPDSKYKIVLLLPCSAKKPYFLSKSHNLFKKAINRGSKSISPFISELIITSPLSVVPRELEGIYPTKFYDIPVSGQWSEKEISITSKLLSDILNKYKKEIVLINHTNGQGYRLIIERIKKNKVSKIYHTSKKSHPTSSESLSNLSSTLKELANKIKEKTINSFLKRRLVTIADYQYGKNTGNILFAEKIKTHGRFPRNTQIYDNQGIIATLRSHNGFLSIQPEIAQKIVKHSKVNLEFDADYIKGSNIFAPGCIKADNSIHPADEILVVKSGEVLGTAKAFVSGSDMNKMTSGALAEVKKKVKKK